VVFKDKREAIESFKELLRDRNVPSNANWDQCVKIISKDPRYAAFKNLNERKQTFNAYKTQKIKDEREESRLKAKKAKEDLEQFLMSSDKMNSQMKYFRCEEVFAGTRTWTAVPEPDRRDIYEDCIFNLAKREKEEARLLKKRNMTTTWASRAFLRKIPSRMRRTLGCKREHRGNWTLRCRCRKSLIGIPARRTTDREKVSYNKIIKL